MDYVCDAPGDVTWFRVVTEGEAAAESQDMRHAVEKYFRREREKAEASFRPASNVFFEQAIGLEPDPAVRRFLQHRRAEMRGGGAPQ